MKKKRANKEEGIRKKKTATTRDASRRGRVVERMILPGNKMNYEKEK